VDDWPSFQGSFLAIVPTNRRIAIVMAGGSGERFWPLSTAQRPKQLLKLTSPDETMLQEAINRIAPLVGPENVVASVSSTLEAPVREASLVSEQNVWAEPMKRNTLGALCWAAAQLLARGQQETTVAVLTADHQIKEPETFRATVGAAMDLAEETNSLVVIGIRPDRPETGYGYIEADLKQVTKTTGGREGYRSLSFPEKPDAPTAAAFLQQGNFLWNAGMFFYTLQTFLRELEQAQPKARALVDKIAEALREGDKWKAENAFAELPSISIDFALAEKAQQVMVVPSDFPWDDVGSWDSLERTLPKNSDGNVTQGDSVLIDTTSSIVVNDSATMKVGVLGVSDVIVVVTDGAVLVTTKDQAQRVREITAKM
jgi:mannose-1-phosphate guanylyltransferase